MTSANNRWAMGLVAVLSLAISLYALSYASGRPFPPGVGENRAGLPILLVHAFASSIAMAAGLFQFWPRLRQQRRNLHRWLGRAYLTACLIGGLAGLAMAWGCMQGEWARWGFGLLAVSWLTTGTFAYRAALRRDFAEHRRWMVRSFALTFAAVTLRLYMPFCLIVPGLPYAPMYQAIAWLCWVPNLLFAEWWLNRRPPAPFQTA